MQNIKMLLKHLYVEDSGKAASYDLRGIMFVPNLGLIASTLKQICKVVEEGRVHDSLYVPPEACEGYYEMVLDAEIQGISVQYEIEVRPGFAQEILILEDLVNLRIVHTASGPKQQIYKSDKLRAFEGAFGGIIGHNTGFFAYLINEISKLLHVVVQPGFSNVTPGLNLVKCTSLDSVADISPDTYIMVSFTDKINSLICKMFLQKQQVQEPWMTSEQYENEINLSSKLYQDLCMKNVGIPLEGLYFGKLRDARVRQLMDEFELQQL